MKDDSASYYDSREFTELLTSYENMLADGGSVYFDSMERIKKTFDEKGIEIPYKKVDVNIIKE